MPGKIFSSTQRACRPASRRMQASPPRRPRSTGSAGTTSASRRCPGWRSARWFESNSSYHPPISRGISKDSHLRAVGANVGFRWTHGGHATHRHQPGWGWGRVHAQSVKKGSKTAHPASALQRHSRHPPNGRFKYILPPPVSHPYVDGRRRGRGREVGRGHLGDVLDEELDDDVLWARFCQGGAGAVSGKFLSSVSPYPWSSSAPSRQECGPPPGSRGSSSVRSAGGRCYICHH